MAKGRPKDSRNTSDVVDVAPSRCPNCGSTERTAYLGNPVVLEYEGTHDGRPYNRIVRRRCRCAACNQARIDRSFELLQEIM